MFRRLRRALVRLVLGLVIVSVGAVLVYRFIDPPFTPLMVARSVETRRAGRPVGIAKTWVHLDRIAPSLVRSVIVAEDATFFRHAGVDLDAVRRAAVFNARHGGRRIRGAGTITMQCARNVFLWQGRSWLRKGLEVWFAWLMELLWGKERILEVYLNVVEWGDGVYGAEAAAQRWFAVPAAGLGQREAALLAAALPNPRRSNPAAPSAYLADRAAVIQARAVQIRLGRVRAGGAQSPRRSARAAAIPPAA
ncbi:MAG TPA: monofunctional biosynthetic peptidoglycan transglycosylase [Candidatus Binatia bacterium]|nr:monofunctional biosynthetic peptidoglycan transglycosylase [Candidatus Binatia bacterium]